MTGHRQNGERMAYQVDLSDAARGDHYPLLWGEEKGAELRAASRLDESDPARAPIILTASKRLDGVSATFFVGLLGPSIAAHGKDRMLLRLDVSQLPPPIQEDVEVGVMRAHLMNEIQQRETPLSLSQRLSRFIRQAVRP